MKAPLSLRRRFALGPLPSRPALFLAGLLVAVSTAVQAQVLWTGAGSALTGLGDADNWADQTLPSSGANIAFGTSPITSVNIPGSLTVGSITFNDTGDPARPSYTFHGLDVPTFTLNGDIIVNAGGDVTLANTLKLALSAATHTANVSGGVTLTVNSNIEEGAGAASIVKAGSGTLVLSGANTYTGTTTINGGVLRLGSSTALPAATSVALGASATLDLAGNNASISSLTGDTTTIVTLGSGDLTVQIAEGNTPFAGSIQGLADGSLIKAGAGTLTLTGQSYFGSTQVQAGTLVVGAENTLRAGAPPPGESSFGHDIDISSGATLDVEANQTIRALSGQGTADISSNAVFTVNLPSSGAGSTSTFAGALNGDGEFVKDGPGALTLSGISSAFTGAVTVKSGTVTVTSDSALGPGNVTTVESGASLILNGVSIGSEQLELSGIGPSAQGALVGSNNGESFDSSVAGQIKLTGDTKIGVSGANDVLELQGSIVEVTEESPVQVPQALSKAGAGNLILSASNEFLGTTQIFGGTLTLNHVDALHHSTLDYSNHGGALSFGSLTSATLGGLRGAQNLALDNAAATPAPVSLTVGNNNENTSYSGVLSGNGSLVKNGTGSLTLSGSNTYGGVTTINSGSIVASHANALGLSTSLTQVNTGATLTLQGVSSAETVKLAGGGLSTMGASSLSGGVTLSGSGIVSVLSGDTLTLSGVIDETGAAATLAKNGFGTLVLGGANTYSGATNINEGTLVLNSGGTLGTTGGATAVNSGATLKLNGADAGNEPLTLSGGTLTGAGTASHGGAITVASGFSTIDVAENSTLTLSGAIGETGGTRDVTKTGLGTLVLSGASTYGGFTTINAGTLRVTANNALPSATKLGFGANSLFEVKANQTIKAFQGFVESTAQIIIDSGKSLTLAPSVTEGSGGMFGGSISGGGSLVIDGANASGSGETYVPGTFVGLTGSVSHTGGTVLNAGTLQIGNNGTSGFVAGNITNNGLVLFSRTDGFTYGGVMSGSGNVSFNGGGTFVLSNQQTYTGHTYVSGSTLRIGATNALPTTTNLGLGVAGATFDVQQSQTIRSLWSDANTTVAIAAGKTLTIAAPAVPESSRVSTFYAGSFSGAGTLAINAADDQEVVLTGASPTFTGTVSISQGLVVAAHNQALGSSTVSLSGGILAVPVDVVIPNSLQLNSGYIGGSGGFTGAATIGANVTVAPEYLTVAASHVSDAENSVANLSFSNLTLAGGGTYALTIEPGVGVANVGGAGGTFYADHISVSGTLTLDAALSSATPFTFKLGSYGTLSLADSYSWTVISAGSLSGTFASSKFAIDTSDFFNSTAGTFSLSQSGNSLVLNFTPVPEPSTWMMLIGGAGVLAVTLLRRRRR